MLKVVFDTSIIVADLRNSKVVSHQLLRLAADSTLVPLISTPLFLEYESVLKRSEHLLASGFT